MKLLLFLFSIVRNLKRLIDAVLVKKFNKLLSSIIAFASYVVLSLAKPVTILAH